VTANSSDLRPKRGVCYWAHCRRRAERQSTLYQWREGTKAQFRAIRHAFCRIHAIENEFGLVAYRCTSKRCLRRRVVASGGWLNTRWSGPEIAYVFIPLEGVLDEESTSVSTPAPLNSMPHCPWCGALLTPTV
jgi:hypothetical protein